MRFTTRVRSTSSEKAATSRNAIVWGQVTRNRKTLVLGACLLLAGIALFVAAVLEYSDNGVALLDFFEDRVADEQRAPVRDSD